MTLKARNILHEIWSISSLLMVWTSAPWERGADILNGSAANIRYADWKEIYPPTKTFFSFHKKISETLNFDAIHQYTVLVHFLINHSLSICPLLSAFALSVCLSVCVAQLNNLCSSEADGCHFPDDILNCIVLNEIVWISFKIHWSLLLRVKLTIFQHWFR